MKWRWKWGQVKVSRLCPAQECLLRDFHGGPVVKTPRFHCKGHRWGNEDPACPRRGQKTKQNKKKECLLNPRGQKAIQRFKIRKNKVGFVFQKISLLSGGRRVQCHTEDGELAVGGGRRERAPMAGS